MRPLLGLVVSPEVDVEELVDVFQHYADHEWGEGHVGLQLLTAEAELRDFQAGHIVLYRKPVRRQSSTDLSYRRADGTVIKREQTTLFGDIPEETS